MSDINDSVQHVDDSADLPEFDVEITETLQKTVTVEAASLEEAERIANENWKNSDYILDSDNFVGVTFKALPNIEAVRHVSAAPPIPENALSKGFYAAETDTRIAVPIRAFILNTGALTEMIKTSGGHVPDELPGKWVDMPTTKEIVRTTLDEIGVDGVKFKSYIVDNYDTDIPGLFNCLRHDEDIDQLNMLASKLAAMPGDDLETFGAVTLSGRHCDSVMDIINVTENIGLFYLQPAFSLEQYGDFLKDLGRDEYGPAVERLADSHEADICKIPYYVDRLDKYFDATAYARDVVKEENGVFTSEGYLTECKGFKEIHTKTVPPEYRVSIAPELPPSERPSALGKLDAAKEAVKANDAGKSPSDKSKVKAHDADL